MQIGFGTPNKRLGTNIVNIRLGEHISFGLGFTPDHSDANIKAFVWTNLDGNSPNDFSEIKMTPVEPTDDYDNAFSATAEITKPGTYIATAFVRYGDHKIWAGVDIIWRVSLPIADALYVRQVPIDKANARQDSDEISTMEDMLEVSELSYTLDKLKNEGVNCLWIQTPYRVDPWDGAHPSDTAGSDYASTDWFSIDPELSRSTRMIPAWDLDRQHQQANHTMKAFITKAHDHGMKVVFGIAPNHVGHNYIFRDYFEEDDRREVRRGDFSHLAVREEQLEAVRKYQELHKNSALALYAEYVFPWMYAAKDSSGNYDPNGADNVYETYSPDWYGYWGDTKHLNHGAHAGQHIWHPATEQNWRVLNYIANAMLWAVVELGVDGFRVDHAYGMPIEFFTQTIPWVEAKARILRSGFEGLILFHEDHDRKNFSANVGDVVQSKWYEEILHSFADGDIHGVWNVYNDHYFTEFAGTGNHDERRGITFFDGDIRAYGNAIISMLFLGGPVTTLAGDEYGESRKLRFKAKGGIPTLWQLRNKQLPRINRELFFWVSKAGRLRLDKPCLALPFRQQLGAIGQDNYILAFEKKDLQSDRLSLTIFSNINHGRVASARFWLGENVQSGIRNSLSGAANSYYQVRDLFSLTPDRPLWRNPIHGRDLIEHGITVLLAPYQVQVLELILV